MKVGKQKEEVKGANGRKADSERERVCKKMQETGLYKGGMVRKNIKANGPREKY